MERPRIKHIAIAVPDGQREKLRNTTKPSFGWKKRTAVPNGGIYLSDGHICLA